MGELIQIADPLKQGQRLGGRLVEVDGNRLVLDAVLTLNPAISYTLSLVIPDGQTTTHPDGSTTTSPKLQVSYDRHMLEKQGRITREVELVNVMAVLPGKSARRA